MLSAVSLLSPNATPMLAESERWCPATCAPRDRADEDPLAGRADLGRVDVLEQQCELVTAEPCHRVALTHAAAESLGDVDQHGVAGRVTEAVVDGLEPVEVDEQQRDAGAAAPRHLQCVLDAVEQQAAVGKVREQVVAGEVGHVLGQPQPRERVRGDRDHRLECLLVGRGGGPRTVPGGRDDPAVALAVAQLSPDLVGAGWGGAHLDLTDPQQPLRVVDESVDDLTSVGQRLRADGGVEQHAEAACVLRATSHRAGGDEQRRQRHPEEDQRPPGVARATTAPR